MFNTKLANSWSFRFLEGDMSLKVRLYRGIQSYLEVTFIRETVVAVVTRTRTGKLNNLLGDCLILS